MALDTLECNSEGLLSQRSPKKWNWVCPQDCRKFMPDMSENSVSLILTDPPYFIDGMGDDWNHDKLKRRAEASGVVKSLPVGMKFDRNQGLRLQNFLSPMACEWLRIYSTWWIRPMFFSKSSRSSCCHSH